MTQLKFVGITAFTPQRLIGKNNQLPWKLSQDLQFFKKTTLNHPILMGRKTYQSLGKSLPNRQNLVLTNNKSWNSPETTILHRPSDLLLPNLNLINSTVFIIGGAQIYALFFPYLDELLVSWVYHPYTGDTYFPEFSNDFTEFELLEKFTEFEIRKYRRTTPKNHLENPA